MLFEPMGLDHTSARTSDFPLEAIAWNHIWQGEDAGWADVWPKTDGLMQSAGGIVASPDDMAAWLQLQLRGQGPQGSGLTAAVVAERAAVLARRERAVHADREGRFARVLPSEGHRAREDEARGVSRRERRMMTFAF